MNSTKLDQLQALADAATSGPWYQAYIGSSDWVVKTITPDGEEKTIADLYRYHAVVCHDAEFIAASRDAVPTLIAEVRRLHSIFAALREPSQAVVEEGAKALYLRGDLSAWCTWEDEMARYKETYYEDALPIIRAAVAAAEAEASHGTRATQEASDEHS